MNAYAIANNLRGFQSTTLRVKVIRTSGEYVWVITADLLDAGTSLVLDASQVEYEKPEMVSRHIDGLVVFA